MAFAFSLLVLAIIFAIVRGTTGSMAAAIVIVLVAGFLMFIVAM